MPKKILIVDDEPHIRILLLQMLEDFHKTGVELLVAREGNEAWRIVQTEHPDLIILDIMMPGLSGYEVCERVKSDPDLSNIYVLILSAKGQTADRRRGSEAGADEYITKPFDTIHLITHIADVLGITVQEPG